MEYPICENGRRIGALTARAEGLYTVFEARLPPREGLTRLYLQGGGAALLLGLMEPRADGLFLRRRLSRARLPPVIERAVLDPGEAAPPPPAPAGADGLLLLPCSPALARDKRLRTVRIAGKCYLVFRR